MQKTKGGKRDFVYIFFCKGFSNNNQMFIETVGSEESIENVVYYSLAIVLSIYMHLRYFYMHTVQVLNIK